MLERVSGTSAAVEPRVLNPQDGADQRRGKHQGQQVQQHVGPRRRRCVPRDPALRRPGSDTTLGLSAETYAAVKAAKYAKQDNFIPFILETDGRLRT